MGTTEKLEEAVKEAQAEAEEEPAAALPELEPEAERWLLTELLAEAEELPLPDWLGTTGLPLLLTEAEADQAGEELLLMVPLTESVELAEALPESVGRELTEGLEE